MIVPVETKVSYCRICPTCCGLLVDVEGDKVVGVRADPDNPYSGGYTCIKGRQSAVMHNHPDRILHSLRRRPDGEFERVAIETAVDEIGERLNRILDEHGPEAIGTFWGTSAWRQAATIPIAKAWWDSIGSHKTFSAFTIDQAAKVVTGGRMGLYLGGLQSLKDSDVWLTAGGNPLVSMQSLGFANKNPLQSLRAEKARGLKYIVIDPRRTETAAYADIHLQIKPGTDVVMFAALLHVIFDQGLDCPEFWQSYAIGIDRVRAVVKDVTPDVAAQICGVEASDIVAAAEMFGRAERGMANGHTGVDMGPGSNVAEHFVVLLNVVCGRYLREGETAVGERVLTPRQAFRAEVAPPTRPWEQGWHSRLGFGLLPSPHSKLGELPAMQMAEEILTPGDDRVRALISVGGNPANAVPDEVRVVEALQSLDLLVTLDPWMSETARLADFVIAPTFQFERPDHSSVNEATSSLPFAMYTEALVPRPGEVIEDWEFFWLLGTAMDLEMSLEGAYKSVHVPLDSNDDAPAWRMEGPLPSSDEVLERVAAPGSVPLADVKRQLHGYYEERDEIVVEPPRPGAEAHRLDLLPDDVEAEFHDTMRWIRAQERQFRLICRRQKEMFNSHGRQLAELTRTPVNPLSMNPDDLVDLGVETGSRVIVTSNHGTITAQVRADKTLRPGAVSLTHGWGGLAGDDHDERGVGSNVNVLMSARGRTQVGTQQPIMTALPVDVRVATDEDESHG